MATAAQAESTASVTWHGSLVDGSGTLTGTGSGTIAGLPVSWASRTGEKGGQTTPEELLAAAHASCYAMAFSHMLTANGTPPTDLEVTARVGFDPKEGGGFKVSFSHLTVKGHVAGIDGAKFAALAQEASQGCPISAALVGNVAITAEATLA